MSVTHPFSPEHCAASSTSAPLTDTTTSEFQRLVAQFGEPVYLGKDDSVTGINQAFWAGLHQAEHIQLFDPDEQAFYRYDPVTGLYSVISEDLIKQEIAARILEVSQQNASPSLERKRTNSNLKHIVDQLKGISEKKNAFQRGNKFVHLANGVIMFKEDGEANFCSFHPEFFSRNQCPISFDPTATCDRFLNELLRPAVTPDNAVLLQKYSGQCLLGNNLIQRLVIIDGKGGRGKTTFVLVIVGIVGRVNVSELRTKHLSERFELFRYLKKSLLLGVDVAGKFLSEKGANVIKGLVGGDILEAELKGGKDGFLLKGDLNVLITTNCRLQVHLDGDITAWERRLLIVRCEGPAPSIPIPDFDALLIREEGPGILNWALQGLGMLFKDIQAIGGIYRSEAQKSIVDALLAESDSLRYFLKENVMKYDGGDLSTQEIIESYAEYCPSKGWNPKLITDIYSELDSLMLELFGTSKAHSLKREGKSAKGFRRVAFMDEDKKKWI